ncbi:hypothetical protein ACFRJ7_11455 [Streptomyces sp. NPDC056747]
MHVHLVSVTKYRRKVFADAGSTRTGDVRRELR